MAVHKLTLGSLFNGIGGWIIAGEKYGVKTLWESEVEKYCEALMRVRYPDVIQLGDVTKIDGAKIPPVDIICSGSPCQSLSVAGKREGLKGESGLFFYTTDIIRRMREATGGKYPRFLVWENVPGALNSSGGNDFRAVLEAIAETEIPMPPNNKWAYAGLVQCDRCEIAWRCMDAQYWGVPQRRNRVWLVADFAESDRRAKEILFVEPSGGRDSTQGEGKGQTVARSTADSVGDAGESADGNAVCLRDRAGKPGGGKGPLLSVEKSLTLQANTNDQVLFERHHSEIRMKDGKTAPTLQSAMGDGGNNVPMLFESHPNDSRVSGPVDTAPTVAARYGTGGNNTPLIMGADIYNCQQTGEKACSVTTATGIPQGSGPKVMTAMKEDISVYDTTHNGQAQVSNGVSPTLNARMGTGGNQVPLILENNKNNTCYDIKNRSLGAAEFSGASPTLTSFMGTGGNNVSVVIDKEKDEVAYTIPHDERSARFVPDKADPMTHYVNYVAVCGTEANKKVTVLNDQGGGVMNVQSDDKVGTLRAEAHGNNPIVLESNQNHATVTDDGVCPTLPAAMGMGGGHIPSIVFEPGVATRDGGHIYTDDKAPTLRANPGDNFPTITCSAGFKAEQGSTARGLGYKEEQAPTLTGNTPTVVYGICSKDSNSMKSGNPHSGIYETEVSRTLDTGGANPNRNQGGNVVVYALEGNGSRPSHQGKGYSDSGKMYTLNTIEQHAVAYGVTTKGNGDAFLSKERHTSLASGGGQAGQGYPAVMQPLNKVITYDIKKTVLVRKHPVDIVGLNALLRYSLKESGLTRKELAEQLNVPQTQVDHYFRTDSCFAIPEKEIWYPLKKLLGITTTYFDAQVTEFVEKECNFDSSNRIYDERGIAPAITSTNADKMILQQTDAKKQTWATGKGSFLTNFTEDVSPTLMATDWKEPPVVVTEDQDETDNNG